MQNVCVPSGGDNMYCNVQTVIATGRGRRETKNGVEIVEIGRKLTELCRKTC